MGENNQVNVFLVCYVKLEDASEGIPEPLCKRQTVPSVCKTIFTNNSMCKRLTLAYLKVSLNSQLALSSTIRQRLDQEVARKFPEAAKLHSRSPLRRSKEKDIDYESQIPLLIAHKSPKEMKVDVAEVANELVKGLQESMPEALERVSVGHGHNLNFRVRFDFCTVPLTHQ